MPGPRPSGRAPQQGGGPPKPGPRPGSGPAPAGKPGGPKPGASRPRCVLEVIDPDDILVIGINGRWFKTFTSSSARYPLEVEVPGEFVNDTWNLVTGDYTNVALTGPKNDASVEYKLKVGETDMVHVTYRTEVQNHTFTVHFKDTFSLRRGPNRGTVRRDASSARFNQYMDWSDEQPEP